MKKIDLHSLPALFCLRSYVAGSHWAVVPQSDEKLKCIVLFMTDSNCEDYRVSKNILNIYEDRVRSQNKLMGCLSLKG
jgi:hypothetical protein